MQNICVYCGSSPGKDPLYLKVAEELGKALASKKLDLVYGGAEVGLMAKISNTVLKKGGKVTGVIPKAFPREICHPRLSKLYVVETMHERKAKMIELADAFIALPGGFGTLEEISEILTLTQLGLNKKPCGILNINGYYDHLLAFFDHIIQEEFMNQEHKDIIFIESSPETLLDKFLDFQVPFSGKWKKEEKN